MEKTKIKIPVTTLPSGGLVNPGVENYNPKNFFIEIEGLSYMKVMQYEVEKSKAKSQIEKLGIEIDYLVPEGALNFPVTDLFAIMLNTASVTGFDVVGDVRNEESAKVEKQNYIAQPYYFSNVVCPACKKKHDKISFNLHQLTCLKMNNLLVEGKMKWRDYIQFDNNEEVMIFKFTMPLIKDFREAIRYFATLPEASALDYNIAIKMLLLSLALTKQEENSTKSLENSYNNLKDLFNIATGGDAMKLERIFNELLVPPVLMGKFCDCEGAPSVLDVTFLITDVLRLQYINSERVTPYLYEFSEELGAGYTPPAVSLHNRNTSALYEATRKATGREQQSSPSSIREEFIERERENYSSLAETQP